MNTFHSFLLFSLFLLIQVVLVKNSIISKDEQSYGVDSNRHTLVKPKIYNRKHKIQNSSHKKLTFPIHDDHITVSLPIDNEELVIDLTLDKHLITKTFFRKTQEGGTQKILRPTDNETNLCHYKGKIRNRLDSWAALSTCNGLSGAIYDGNQMYYIDKRLTEDDVHFLYTQKTNVDLNRTQTKFKRSVTESNATLKGPYNANKESRYVELVLVVDNSKYTELNESVDQVELYCKSIVNVMNGLYSPLNIYVALKGVVIWTEFDEIEISVHGDKTLSNFLRYRRQNLSTEFPNDNAQLITKNSFDNNVIGKALKGAICTYQYSGGITTDFSSVAGTVATSVAHMLGHNFGMEHDTPECTCPDDRCIMSASSSSVVPTQWSSCSKKAIQDAFNHGLDYCLKNKPEQLFNQPTCGNGFVEEGEECDCGLPEYCKNNCCDASTCTLKRNATCATGECCDLETCNIKETGILCRPADGECDLPEYCTGESEFCPTDVFKLNGEVCKNNTGYCYQNQCNTRSDQCKLLWGETGRSSENHCYTLNVKGNLFANCGYNWVNGTSVKCDEEDIFCGSLQCQHEAKGLQFGLEATSILRHSFINLKGTIIACRSAIIDLGIEKNPGLVLDGTKCGENKMCVNQKCVSVSTVQKSLVCPHNCYNNGWCNSLGHCHCKVGYAQPYCQELLYPGGSIDSGPAKL